VANPFALYIRAGDVRVNSINIRAPRLMLAADLHVNQTHVRLKDAQLLAL